MTTSSENARQEITRFLQGTDPQTLCVTGKWGVGKTFLWSTTLDDLRKSNRLSLTRYSYVSLFGLNSLDDVKSALFENMEWLDQNATSFTQRGKAAAKAIAARAKKFSELAGALPWIGQALSKARPLYFSIIQNQIVCIDDLDRKPKNLDLKDVLGLISFLREQRECKVALLLNADQLGENKGDFDRLLEKVIDAKVVLNPTASEAGIIALPDQDEISVALRRNCVTLDICNIRVIKHIERLARRVDELLSKYPVAIRTQAIHSITLFGWSKYDQENAPPLEFLKTSSLERALSRRDGETPQPAEEAAWESLLEKYQFRRMDNFDFSLLKYVDTLVLNADEIFAEARALQEQQRLGALHGTFEGAWRAFHDSFADDEDEVVRNIVEGTKKAYEVVSLSNLNEVVKLLKALGREPEAEEVLRFFADHRDDAGYWHQSDDPFVRGPFDANLASIIEQKKPAEPKEFDVEAALLRGAKEYDHPTIAKLAAVPVQTYVDLISTARGDRLRFIVLAGLDYRRISNATDDMRRVVSLMEEALRLVGKTTRLNEPRINKYGVSV